MHRVRVGGTAAFTSWHKEPPMLIELFVREFPHRVHVVGRLVHAKHTDCCSGVHRCVRMGILEFAELWIDEPWVDREGR